MSNIWNLPSGSTLSTLIERVTVSLELPLANGLVNPSIVKISGSLPSGLRLVGTRIEGTPFQVSRDEISTFVLRATLTDGRFEDRTFQVVVSGPDSPIWLTNEGLLPIGNNGLFFIVDSSLVDFELQAIDEDIPAGDELEYFIADDDGELPPGLTLSADGRISGIVDPILALDRAAGSGYFDANGYDGYPYDFGVLSASGYDSFFYDSGFYDDAIPTRSPKKLNRFYQFAVTVSDGDTVTRRVFRIYVVGDDFLRADNTIMQAGTGLFTADNTYVRTPIWLTPSELGYRRADNYLTLFLDTLDTSEVQGKIRYQLVPENDDNTLSVLPPGMTLDSITGEIYGRVPYQPAVTREYKFTVRATRFTGDINQVTVTGVVYEDTLIGKTFLKINKLPTGLDDGVDDLNSLLNRRVKIENSAYTITAVNGTFDNYDLLTLSSSLAPAFAINLNEEAISPQTYIFVKSLVESQKVRLQGSTFRFTDTELYNVQSITPFTTWVIEYSDSSNLEIDPTNIGLPSVVETFDEAVARVFPTAVFETNADNQLILRVPSTSTNRNISRIESLFAPSNSLITIEATLTDFYDRIDLDVGLQRTLEAGRNIGIGAYSDTSFSINVITGATDETTQPFKDKTFTVKILGDVESTITWLTPSDLGTINANFLSTFKVEAQTSVPNAKLLYRVIEGRLPPGLEVVFDGEIIGKVKQFGEVGQPGLTVFDSGNCIFDGADTSFDREYVFTVEARDRFNFSATTRTFTISVIDPNDLLYSNLYLKPFLPISQRQAYTQLISNPDIFPSELIYRPNDPAFGLQRDVRILAYAGIETKEVENYVAAVAKNHGRKKFKLGNIRTAIAKNPGSNDIVYEVVYVEVIDPYESRNGKVRESFSTLNNDKITADMINYDTQKDSFQTNTGLPEMYVNGNRITTEQLYHKISGDDTIITIGDEDIIDENGNMVTVVSTTDSEPFKFRPRKGMNTITADSDAVNVGNKGDNTRYISNITNMRNRIKETGVTERNFLPLWMRTAQLGGIQEIGYTLALPLCYCIASGSSQIKLNLENNGFDFKTLNFEIDRYVIDSTTGNSNEQYILFANYQFNIA